MVTSGTRSCPLGTVVFVWFVFFVPLPIVPGIAATTKPLEHTLDAELPRLLLRKTRAGGTLMLDYRGAVHFG